jgi:hypothetical protein
MKKGVLLGAAVAGAAYWASRQPGGIPGTWGRLQQGVRDVAAGQDPLAVGKRFLRGGDEEPAGVYDTEPDAHAALPALGQPQQPYRDYVTAE